MLNIAELRTKHEQYQADETKKREASVDNTVDLMLTAVRNKVYINSCLEQHKAQYIKHGYFASYNMDHCTATLNVDVTEEQLVKNASTKVESYGYNTWARCVRNEKTDSYQCKVDVVVGAGHFKRVQ